MLYRKPVLIGMLLCSLISSLSLPAQLKGNIYTADIDHFWTAFDSIQTTKDSSRQIAIMQSLYINKGTPGLREFMHLRDFDARRLTNAITKYPLFWRSIRNNTLKIAPRISVIKTWLEKLKAVYPEMKPANVYFTISAVRSAGVTHDSTILIAAEIAMGDQHTIVSEFPDKRLANFFKPKESVDIIPIIIHEYVHAQQKTEGKNLLGQCIYEGACDFITELVLNKQLNQSYLIYGRQNEQQLKAQFKKEMYGDDYSNWLYNGTTTTTMGDLGYFMGYAICQSYYRHAKDKQDAIKQVIRLNYADTNVVNKFLLDSKYYKDDSSINQGKLVMKTFLAPSVYGNKGQENPNRSITIYLPPFYDSTSRRYPVIYYLHGYQNSDTTAIATTRINQLLDTAILSGAIKPVIMVFPNSNTNFGGSFYTNSTLTGKWADFIAKDVIAFVDSNFRSIPKRNARGLTGISMGGHGALKIAMLYPEVFGSVYAMTPAVLNWSAGNNLQMPAFKVLQTAGSREAITDDFRALLMANLGRTYSPNETKPPFYADFPVSYHNNKLVVNNKIAAAWRNNFPTMMIVNHIDALKSLRALKIDWGRNDDSRHVPATCLEFSKELEKYGIPHFAEEYLGGHADKLPGTDGRIYTEMLPFFNTYLEL